MNPLTGLLVVAALATVPPGPIPPTRVTVRERTLAEAAKSLEAQTGIAFELSSADATATGFAPQTGVPFWQSVEAIAAATGHRVRPGKQVAFVKGPRLPTAIDGPFRIEAKGVTAKADYETGRTVYDLQLELAWEPRFPVFRVDAQPTITSATDNRGTKLTVPAVGAKSPTTGFTHTTTVRIDGVIRDSRSLSTVTGTYTVSASPRMLAFAFDDIVPTPIAIEKDGVKATLAGIVRREDRWDVTIKLEYPTGHPEFESFESWTGGNRIRLVPPGGTGAAAEESFDVAVVGRSVTAEYRFPASINLGDRKGWRLVYETPAPLVEFPVRFTLKDLPLP